MKKILVTTDFSAHSKAAIRFAIQLSTQVKAELFFFHAFQALVPSTVFSARIEQEIAAQTKDHMRQLMKFVSGIYRSANIKPGVYQCVVMEQSSPAEAIQAYAKSNGIDYICISTRGAGLLHKIVGTVADAVMLHADVPVMAVPYAYRRQPIRKLMYVSDLENLDDEMPLVDTFAKKLSRPFDLVHFYYPAEIKLDAETLMLMWRRSYKQLSQLHFQQADIDAGFADQLNVLMRKIRPSIAVFFTHRNPSWFDKLFARSRSMEFSLTTNVPMIIFKKDS